MLKNSLFFSLIIATVFVFVGCQPKEMEIQSYAFENVYPLSADTALGSLTFGTEVEIPVKYRDNDVLKNVQKQLIARIFGEVFNSVPLDSILPLYGEILATEYRKSNEPFIAKLKDLEHSAATWQNEIIVQGVTMFLDDKLLSYSYERYAYMGGAHGNSSRFLYNFDLKTGRIFNESDLFIENYEMPLTQLIKQQIVDDNAEMESIADLSEFHFFEDEIKPNNNFYINGDGIVYVYNQYDIAPYSTGQTEVLLDFHKIKPLLKPNNPLSYFYQ